MERGSVFSSPTRTEPKSRLDGSAVSVPLEPTPEMLATCFTTSWPSPPPSSSAVTKHGTLNAYCRSACGLNAHVNSISS
eukprot:1968360-Pleurochrysis_carterae.AAC.2